MAPNRTGRRRVRDLRRRPNPYPIGTRIAEGYGMDLDREAREGRPADRIGWRPAPPEPPPRPLRPAFVVFLIAAVVLAIAMLPHYPPRRAAPAGPAVTNHWSDMREAGRAHALAEGWIPSFVPGDAFDIRERHDPATWEGWLAFRFPAAEGPKLADRMVSTLSADDRGTLSVRGPGEDWWPAGLRGRLDDRAGSSRWVIYRTGRQPVGGPRTEYLAIDRESSRACLWRESR